MRDNLANRYIYAVVRHLPKRIREDVEKELDGLIYEMLDERCGNYPPAESDVKAVLTELGTPEELAAKYSGDEQRFLISGVYFINYKRILKLVVPIVAAAVLLGLVIAAISDIAAGITEHPALFAVRVAGQTLGGVIAGAFHAFGVITIIFAVLERFKVSMNSYGDDFLDVLPEAPQKSARIGIGEPIFNIVLGVMTAVLLLGVPQIIGGRLGPDDEWITVLDIAVLRSLWLPIILYVVLGIIAKSVALLEGRYTKWLAVVTVVTNLLIIGCIAIIFLRDTIMNPQFVSLVESTLYFDAAFIVPWLSNTHIFVFVITCVVAVIESVSISIKAWKYDK